MINPLDIIIFSFLLLIALISFNDGIVKNTSKLINLITSIILTNLFIENLNKQFTALNRFDNIFALALFILVLIIFMICIGFLIELITEQIEFEEIEKVVDILLSIIINVIKGFVIIALVISILDLTPLSDESKNTLNSKIESESILFKPIKVVKEFFFNK